MIPTTNPSVRTRELQETCALDIDDLGHHRGQRTAQLTREGGKTQTIPMSHRTAWAVGAARNVGRVARAAGVTKRITPLSLRHTFVTMALDAGQAELGPQLGQRSGFTSSSHSTAAGASMSRRTQSCFTP